MAPYSKSLVKSLLWVMHDERCVCVFKSELYVSVSEICVYVRDIRVCVCVCVRERERYECVQDVLVRNVCMWYMFVIYTRVYDTDVCVIHGGITLA